METSRFKRVLSCAMSGIIAVTTLFGSTAGAAISPADENVPEVRADSVKPGYAISETADENGLYDVTFTVDVYNLGFDTAIQEVYLYGSFARYPTNVTQWSDTHQNAEQAAMMEDWWLAPLGEDKTIPDIVIPSDYADGSNLEGTAPLEQPTYAQMMKQVGDSSLYTVTLKLPASPYYYRYAVNPEFTLSTAETVSTSNAILPDRKAYTIRADYLSFDPSNPSVSNPAGGHIQSKSMIVVGDGDYYHKDDSVPKGEVTFVPYTDVNSHTRYLGVYLPAGYDENGAAYKTLYMSHGAGGEETEWMNKGRVQDVFDWAIANDEIEPTIVVTMDNTADYGWDMETIRENLMDYIIPFVEENYNVSKDVEDRAMMGLSMGGITTSYLYMTESQNFGSFIVLSAASTDELPLDDVSRDAKLMVGTGEEDFGWTSASAWMERLDAAGIEYTEKNVPGTHDWYTWSQMLNYVACDFLWEDDSSSAEPGVVISDEADENGLYDVTFTLDTSDLALENPVEDVYLYGSFARYPTNVTQWSDTHQNAEQAAMMEDWWLAPLGEDKTIPDIVIPSDYADGSNLEGTAPLEQPTYAQMMKQVGDSSLYTVTLKLPASPYYYRYAVNPEFTLSTAETVSTSNAILPDRKAYTIRADYLSFDPSNPSVSNPAGGHIQSKSMIVVGDGDYYHKDDSVPKGEVTFVPYTDVNSHTRYLGVYLPAGYDENGAAYKTLYMSHGAGGEETEWMNKGRVQDVFDWAIANDEIEPTIVVTMDNTADYGWDMETIRENLMDYIIPFVEENYNVSKDVEDRAMMGLSMGGVTTSYIYMNESENFGYFAVLSGSTVEDPENYPLSAVSRDAKLFVGAGEEDFGWAQGPSAPGSFSGIVHFMQQLDEAGIEYTEYNVAGTHDWYTWSQLLDYVACNFLWEDDSSSHGGSSGGGGSSSNRPDVSVDGTGGKVSASDNGTVTITPDEGYEISKITVNGKEVAIPADGKLTGLDKNDEVVVTFEKIETEQPDDGKEPFADVADGAWYADAVQYVYENGMMNGISDTQFGPDGTTTRAMIVTILHRLENEPAAAASDFTDVAAGSYYADAVAWAAENGIVNGISDSSFAPDNAITREQLATILYRYAQFKGYDVTADSSLDAYTDASQISSYAETAMQWASGEGLINGVTATTLDPQGSATRAQVATILMRFVENIAA